MSILTSLDEILTITKEYKHVFLTGHIHPDGDCIGATLAMQKLLFAYDVHTKVVYESKPSLYDYLEGYESSYLYEEFRAYMEKEDIQEGEYVLIVMDSGDITRIEPIQDIFEKAAVTCNIDHHISNDKYGMYNMVKTDVSSTSEIVASLITKDSDITPEIAACLYTGIIYDTGVFKHSSTKASTHIEAARLIATGIDFTEITRKLFFTRSSDALVALEIALQHLEITKNGKIATTVITYEQLRKHHLTKAATEGIVAMLNEIEHTYACAFLLELTPNEYKVSLRSNTDVDVCRVAKTFGGGGHIKAAGCTVHGDVQTVVAKVLREIEKQL